MARQIGQRDAKFDVFEETLREALAEGPTSKALVFSFFKGTLEYLKKRLRALGYDVDVIHGDVKIPDRTRVIERFRTEPGVRVLLSSEVGAEGLDFQFCDVLVNYDLPWNPMQVEQRIGRLDRFGQEHERIRIYNLYIEDTIETRIFQRLYDRINIFRESIGDLEAILGEVIGELSRAALQASLTSEEQERLADEVAGRIVRQQQAAEDLEREKDQFLGQDDILDQRVREAVETGRVVTADEVCATVRTFLAAAHPRVRLVGDPEEPCWTLEFDSRLGDHIRRVIQGGRLENRVSQHFMAALQERRKAALTFDSEFARQRPNLEFITTRHPLAVAALDYWQEQGHGGIPAARLVVKGAGGERGEGFFFIYTLSVQGTHPSISLKPIIALNDGSLAVESAKTLLGQLVGARAMGNGRYGDEPAFAEAQQRAAAWMGTHRDEVEREAGKRNQALLSARTASINASFGAKKVRAEQLLSETWDERVRRMRKSQIANLEARRNGKLEELVRTSRVSVAYGLIAGGAVLLE